MSIEDDMKEIARLVPLKRHRLASNMVDGRTLTPAAAQMVLRHLNGCPDKSVAEPAGDGPWTTRSGRQLTGTDVDQLPAEAGRGYDVPRETSREDVIRHNPAPITAYMGLPAGYYATPSLSGNNDLDFWRIDKPETPRWAGRIFVKRIVGGGSGDEMQTFQLNNMQQRLACEAITGYGADKSQALFATEMTRCIDCGRMLTDQASRDAGRGPTCRNKRG